MTLKKNTFFVLFLFISTTTLFSQNIEIEIPEDYRFESKADYASYEPKVKEIIEWSLSTTLGDEAETRSNAYAFMLSWMMGTPNVTLNLNLDAVNVSGNNPELLLPFMMGYVRYSLENDYSKDEVQKNKAGVEAAVKFYEKNRRKMRMDDEIENFQKLISKGELEAEIEKKLKKDYILE